MANSKFEYVKLFEQESRILNNCWFVVRIDGRGFTKFTEEHSFVKPNDIRGIDLMNAAAIEVMREFKDIVISYGESDEYSFVFTRSTDLWNRRSDKILSSVVSLFSAAYIMHWPNHFPDTKMKRLPMFDGRVVCYPTDQNLRDYMSWRQVDCHINNLFNTTFWTLVNELESEFKAINPEESAAKRSSRARAEAQQKLLPTFSADKNEMLFQRGINYNNLPPVFKKGTILVREMSKRQKERLEKKKKAKELAAKAKLKDSTNVPPPEPSEKPSVEELKAMRDTLKALKLDKKTEEEEKLNQDGDRLTKSCILLDDGISINHVDLVEDDFWNRRPHLLANEAD
eukprot:GDKJ01016448.1.p1 GENE.GDKJ01016448.1~~GDKJ01016448.1.p1  ORF type:complete len:341 (-),score=79.85 GDKJ01016448.1:100-1122(-)